MLWVRCLPNCMDTEFIWEQNGQDGNCILRGRSRQVWCGQVHSVYISTLQLGWSGGSPPTPPPPQKILWLFPRPFLARRQSFTCMKSSNCIVQHWFRLSDGSLISQATPFTDEACETTIVRLEEHKVVGWLGRVLSHCLQPFRKFQDVRCVVGGLAWVSAEQWC